MSQTSKGSHTRENERGKREVKLTAKALEIKIERLQNERKTAINKIKALIPQMKSQMKLKENVTQISLEFENLNALCEQAHSTHNELLPLLPEEEKEKHKEWFITIMEYAEAFIDAVKDWQKENLNENAVEPEPPPPPECSEIQVEPGDSVSNVGSKTSRSHRSSTSRSSTQWKAEAELVILEAKQKLLEENHALQEEEERLRKKREKFKLDSEIAEKMATLNLLKAKSSVVSGSHKSRASDGMNSYLEKKHQQRSEKSQLLNINATEFIPSLSTKPKMKSCGDACPTEKPSVPAVTQIGNTFREDSNGMVDIMRKQNEITSLLIQQQCLSALPKREIPVFDGDPLKFYTFMRAFENGVECNTNNNYDRLYFLEQYTKGYAKELVRSCQYIDAERGYFKAKALLKEHYGNEQKVASAYMERALSWPQIKAEDVKALLDYSLFLRSCCNAMEDVQYLRDLDTPSNMLDIIKKLPYRMRERWRSHACDLQEKSDRRARFTDITAFVEKQVKILTDPVFGNIQDSPTMYKGGSKPKIQLRSGIKGTSFATTVDSVERKCHSENKSKDTLQTRTNVCPCCEERHSLEKCVRLEKMAHKDKIRFLKENGFCYSCLCKGHISKECRKRMSCFKCGLKHPVVLHRDNVSNSEQIGRNITESVDNTLVSSGLTGAGEQNCKLPIVPVQVKAKKGNKIICTYAFLDQGSTAVFCTEDLLHRLHLTGRRTNILLRTMGQERVVNSYVVPELEVAALHGESFIDLPRAYTQKSMPVYQSNIPTERDLRMWPHLKHLTLPQINAGIDLLIGTNISKAMEPLEVIHSVNDGPYAIRTALGWTVNGPLTGGNSGQTIGCESVTVNRVSVIKLDELWQQQFKNDFPETAMDEQPGLSREDQKFLELVNRSVKHLDGHYQIGLPWREPEASMPDNKKVVEQRLHHLKRRLQRDPLFHSEYTTFMNDLLVKDYAERIPEKELNRCDGKVWYIPHHGVHHPTKGKLRVVFDCGASFQGKSLNEQLLQGPDLTSSLIGVVTRFRKEAVVIMADIESMFYQVRVPPEDADLLRFLWWPQGELGQEPAEFRMKVHLFGATSSPACANFALKKCAEDFGHLFKEETVNKILHCFYVDDCLVSVQTEEEAVTLYRELVALCERGGFCLTKWLSNRPRVLECIPETNRAKGVIKLDFEQPSLPVERVLGVEWCIQSDMFKFKIVLKERPLTRRGILSTVSSIYDPLGMLSPVVLVAKLILRDLCRRALGWDEPIPEAVSKEWINWIQGLHLLDNFRLNRCFKPVNFGDVITAQLHHFCDASQDGYGSVTYLLLQNERHQRHIAFIMGKSRVAPMKTVTIPRMELVAATMASRMDVLWRKELHIKLQDSVFWTDSASVLKYIRNKTSRFKVFVANRVAEILKSSHQDQWRYVDTGSNPADAASRGVKVEKFLRDSAWVSAPHFLSQPESEWPANHEADGNIWLNDPEVKNTIAVNTVRTEEDPTSYLVHYFSSWTRLRKSVAWMLRYKRWLLSRCKKREELQTQPHLTVEDLNEAELAIIQFSQKRCFSEEIKSLEKGESVKINSRLRALCPTLEDGILRVGGRLSRSSMPTESKHPVILAKELHISTLLLRHIHQEVGHGGRNHMLSKLFEKYWMIGASTAIKGVLSRCTICRRQNVSPVYQQMADLPKDRIQPDQPPFTCVGVDYFGPFEVKSRRSIVKRYGVLFTCLASRAVHIEMASSLDTDSFIDSLRRFIARRGQVQELRSDNGTNFIGAERELKVAIEKWNKTQINNLLLQKGIKWTFNPPAGSHHGGVWERLIRSVRKVLNSTFKVQRLDEEGLQTALCEVEAIVNSRPITKASMDPNDLEALTPNHLLLQKNLPSLPPGVFQPADVYATRRWRQVQYMSDLFWKRWTKEYLPLMQERQRWTGVKRNLMPGDIVIVVDSAAPRNSWIMGRVLETFPDKRGFVRQVRIKTKTSCLDRPITKVCLLMEADIV